MSTAKLPERLSLLINGECFQWVLNGTVHSPAKKRPDDPRQHLLVSLYRRLLPLSYEQQQTVLKQLQEWTGEDSSQPHDTSALTAEEVLQLAAGGLFEIGAHSVTHPLLSVLTPASQRFEIRESKAYLENLLGRPLSGFSYPNGDASECTRAMVEEAVFGFACASFNEVISRRSDRFYLPRFWTPDWDGRTFSRWLLRWLGSSMAT
jgi:hypothetical protein